MRRRVLLAVKACVSAALLAWVVHTAVTRDGVDALGARLAAVSWQWVAVAAAVQLAAVGAGLGRWRVLLEAQGIRLGMGWLARSYLIGRFVGTFTPSTAGLDVYRVWDVARRTGQRGRAAGTVVIERLVGLLGLSLACLVLLPAGGTRFFGPGAVAGTLLVGAGAVAGLWVLRHPGAVRPWLARLPAALRPRAESLREALGGDGLSRPVAVRAVGLSVLSHLLTSAVFVATAAALGLGIDPPSVLVAGNAIVVATLLPVSVGGVGVREGVAVALLARVGASATDATLVALLGYLVGQVPGILGGALAAAGALRHRAPEAATARATPDAPPLKPRAHRPYLGS